MGFRNPTSGGGGIQYDTPTRGGSLNIATDNDTVFTPEGNFTVQLGGKYAVYTPGVVDFNGSEFTYNGTTYQIVGGGEGLIYAGGDKLRLSRGDAQVLELNESGCVFTGGVVTPDGLDVTGATLRGLSSQSIPDLPTALVKTSDPVASDGYNGSICIQVVTGHVWVKVNGSWVDNGLMGPWILPTILPPPALRSNVAQIANGWSQPCVVPLPAGTLAGDTLLLFIYGQFVGSGITGLNDWTQISGPFYTKVATAADVATGSCTFSAPTGYQRINAGMLGFSVAAAFAIDGYQPQPTPGLAASQYVNQAWVLPFIFSSWQGGSEDISLPSINDFTTLYTQLGQQGDGQMYDLAIFQANDYAQGVALGGLRWQSNVSAPASNQNGSIVLAYQS